MGHDDENELTIRDAKRREEFEKEYPGMEVVLLQIGNLFNDIPNSNGVVYTKEAAEKMLEDFRNRVKEKSALIFDNVDGQSGRTDLMRAGALITEARLDDDRVIAKIKILDTDSGRRLGTCLKHFSDSTRLRMQLTMDSKFVGVFAEDVSKIPFPK